MKKFNLKFMFAGVILTVLLGGCAGGSGTDSVGTEKPVENGSAQETEDAAGSGTETVTEGAGIVFTGQDLAGNSVSESFFSESKLTMVNVWATYCNPCLSEMPGLGELAGEYEPEEFQIIGIVSDVPEGADEKAIEEVASLIEATGADYPHLLLNESVYYALLTEVTAVPTTFFVDENGVVLDTVLGAMKKSAWEEKINALLEKQ